MIPWQSVLTLWLILGMAACTLALYLALMVWGLVPFVLGG